MDEELDLELEAEIEPERSPDGEGIESPSPVRRFMDDFEQTLDSGDPFRITQRTARESRQVLAETQAQPQSGLFALSEKTNNAFRFLGERTAQSAREMVPKSRLKIPGQHTGRLQGFVSRALPSDYSEILQRPGEFKASFFQFQQEDVVNTLLQRSDPTTLVTQRPRFTSPTADETTAQILLGNELTIQAGSALRRPNHSVLGVQSYASFHPKVGYVGDPQRGMTAFLGTQNVTPALAGNNSLESLMVFSTPGYQSIHASPTAEFERTATEEIYQLTNALTQMVADDEVYRPGQLRKYLTERRAQRNFLYVEQEIYQRMSQALSVAAFNPASKNDRVVISMGEISLLMRQSKNGTAMLQAIAQLARENRLNIITDNRRTTEFFDALRTNPQLSHNRALVDLLLKSGSLQVATTGYQHDKTVAVFGQNDQLKFFNIGSANLSADSMTPIKRLGVTDEYFDKALGILKQRSDYDQSAPMNLDVNLMLGTGPYSDLLRQAPATEAYLQQLTPHLYQHYTSLSAGRLKGRSLYSVGYLAERHADPTRVETLRQSLETLSQQLGGLIEVSGRYDLSGGNASQVGLAVRVRGQGQGGSTKLNLSVDRYGNVILSDTNKVITGSVFVNKSTTAKQMGAGRSVGAGQTVQLSGIETAVGLVGTVARELSYQSKFGVVDTLFARLQETHYADMHRAGRDLIAKSIQKGSKLRSDQPLNLATVLYAFDNQPELHGQFGDALLNAVNYLATGDQSLQLNESDQNARFSLLKSAFTDLLEQSYTDRETQSGKTLNRILETDTSGLLNDLKLALILSTDEGKRQYAAIQSTQARRLVQDLTAPFLGAHELGYASTQGQARLPIYAETQTYDTDTQYGRILNHGFLNPAEVKPGTRIGQPGTYFRPVGATAHAKPLKLPGFGNIRQLNVIDSDISTGAAVAYDLKRIFSSTLGLAVVQKDQMRRQLRQVYASLEQSVTDELLEETLYLTPFTKAEQIPQRLKNVVGTRPAVDVNPELVRKLRSLQQVRLDADSVLSGRLREVLPQAQFDEVAARSAEGYSAVQEYYRSLELDPLNTQRGYIGPQSMKRVAIVGGVSLIGDSSYLNAGYAVNAGDVHRTSVKVSSRQILNQLQTQALLSKYMAPGNMIFGAPVVVEDTSILQRLQDHLDNQSQPLTVTTLQSALENFEDGRHQNLLVKNEGGRFRLYYKEGLYAPSKDSYERIGSFTQDGLVTVKGIGTHQDTLWGSRHQAITLKFPAFGKRYQEGVSVILSTPSVQVSDSGTIQIQTDVLTTWKPGSGSRPAGAGLVKGPFSVIKSEIFDQIHETVSDRVSVRPQALAAEKLYGLFGHGHFKGFNYEAGLFLLSQQDTRSALTQRSGTEMAKSLSLLFLGDSEVKQALQSRLRSERAFLIADSLEHVKAADFAAIKDGVPATALGRVAMGLTMLSDSQTAAMDAAAGSLASVKQTVLRALQNDQSALQTLERQTRKLVNTVMTSPESAIRFNNGQVILNEANLLARGAGLMAHLSFLGQQLFSPSLKPSQASVGALYERDLSNPDRYLGDIGHRNTVDAIAATAGLSLPAPTPKNREEIRRKLAVLQAMVQNDVVIEDIKDIGVSRSLVPTGMKDEAALEYQYLLGMSSSYLKAFTKVGGGSQASRELQHAFARLVGSFRVDLPSANAQLGYRLALPGEDGFFGQLQKDTQHMLLSYTQLGEQLGLVQEAIEQVSTAKGASAIRRLERFQRLVTGMTADGADHIQARAIAANRLFNLSFFSTDDPTTSKSARLQAAYLRKYLGVDASFAPGESAFGIVTETVKRAYQSFVEDRFVRQQTGQMQTSFRAYVQAGHAGNSAQALEDKYQLITDLTQSADRIPGVPLTTDDSVLTNKIAQRLSRLNDKSISAIQSAYETGLYKEFVHGALAVESRLQHQLESGATEQTKRMLKEVQQTQQIVFPQFEATAITDGENAGRYKINFRDPGVHEASTGVLLGTDVLKKAPLIFPQYTDEALRHQVDLRQKLMETERLREKLLTPGATITEKQLRQLQSFQETLEASRSSVLRILDTDFTRKALGDRQSFAGTVGIAMGSFALDSDQTALGDRFFALGDSRQTLSVINNQFQILRQTLERTPDATANLLTQTQELTRALGYRTNEESVTEKFAQAIDAANQKQLTKHQLNELRVHTISALANIPVERVQQSNQRELDRLMSLSSGSIRRGGAPAGSSALTADTNLYDVQDVQTLQARIQSEGGALIPEETRFKTGMLVPAVGRLLTMLGDFDGDAYQFLLTGTADHAAQLKQLQRASLQLGQKLSFVDRQISAGKTPELEAQRLQILTQMEEVQTQLSRGINQVSEHQVTLDRSHNRALKDVRQWVGAYLALPDFVTEGNEVSTGTLMSMVQQMSGTMPQIEDGANHIQTVNEQVSALTSVFTDFDSGSFSMNNPQTQERMNQALQLSSKLSSSMVEGVLSYAQDQQAFTSESFEASARNYLSLQANLSMTFEQVNKTMKKSAGLMLNPFDFEGLQGVIGQAGTELIGKTYNVLVPLLDQTMLDQAIVTGLQTTGESSFRSVIDESLQTLAAESSLAEATEINRLRRKLLNGDTQGLQQQLSGRFSAVTGTLASMQQIIRDALKEKSDKGIINVLREATFEGKPLTEALESVEADSPVDADKQRSQILRDAVMTRIGPSLAVGSEAADYGITGFGALLRLSEFATTDTSELYDRFVADQGLEDTYKQQLRQGTVSNITEFAAGQVLTLMERAQASFISGTFSESAKETLVGQLRSFASDADPTALSPVNRRIYHTVQEYEDGLQSAQDDAERHRLNNRLLQDTTLAQLQSRNRDQHVLGVQQLTDLRDFYMESQTARFNDGDIYSRMQGANVDTYNAYLRMLQRGQQPNVQDVLYMADYKVSAFANLTGEANLSAGDEMRMGRLLGLRPGSGVLSPVEQEYFAKAMLKRSKTGITGLQSLQNSTAAMTQGVFPLIDELETSVDNAEGDRAEALRKQLSGLYEHGVNVDKLFNAGRLQLPHEAAHTQNLVSSVAGQLSKITNPQAIETTDERPAMLQGDPRLETMGIFVAPALLALAGSNIKLDDRVGMFALDVMQSTALLTSQSGRLTAELAADATSAADFNFAMGRVKQSMETEGMAVGALQGFIQESMFKGISQMAYSAIDGIASKLPGGRTRVGNAIATVAAETFGTVVSLGMSRSMVKQKTRAQEFVPDRIGDILQNVTEQIWQMVEQAQLAMNDPEYEVMDHSANQQVDFEVSAVPSQFEQDVETGLIILDEDMNPIATELESVQTEQLQMAAGFN